MDKTVSNSLTCYRNHLWKSQLMRQTSLLFILRDKVQFQFWNWTCSISKVCLYSDVFAWSNWMNFVIFWNSKIKLQHISSKEFLMVYFKFAKPMNITNIFFVLARKQSQQKCTSECYHPLRSDLKRARK